MIWFKITVVEKTCEITLFFPTHQETSQQLKGTTESSETSEGTRVIFSAYELRELIELGYALLIHQSAGL